MCISKQIQAIKNCFYGREAEVTYMVSTYDSDNVTYYVKFSCGTTNQFKREFEITVCRNKIIWLVTDEVGMCISEFDRLKKAIREAK